MTIWPSGLRRWLKAPFRKGVGSNPTVVTFSLVSEMCTSLTATRTNYAAACLVCQNQSPCQVA